MRRSTDGVPLGWAQATVRGTAAGVAYALLPAERGHGAASDALRALTAWLRGECGVGEISASISSANAASERVARAAGFVPTERRADDEVVWIQAHQPGT